MSFLFVFCLIMSSLVTIMSFSNMPDLSVIRGRLETEGIKCFVQDEYTTQARLGFSDAYGGIRLQVMEEDAGNAVNILKEYGYLNEVEEKPSELTESLDKMTNKLPFLHQYPLQVKLLAIIFFTLAVIITVFFFKNNH